MNKLFRITLVGAYTESLTVPCFFLKDWYDIPVGKTCFKDMLSTSGHIFICLQFKEKYDFNIYLLNYFALVYATPPKQSIYTGA